MGKDLTQVKRVVFICNGGSCEKKGAEQNTLLLRQAILEQGMHEQVHTVKTKCTGQCEHGPMVFIHPDGMWYKKVDARASTALVAQHLVNSKPLTEHVLFTEGCYRNNQTNTKGKISGFYTRLKRLKAFFRLVSILIL